MAWLGLAWLWLRPRRLRLIFFPRTVEYDGPRDGPRKTLVLNFFRECSQKSSSNFGRPTCVCAGTEPDLSYDAA
ncbi:hypothetical protein B0H14DRAFT_2945736 [Mycena olivaceomarginata]|nr:hypothetical protein B0H14DRAFT_2945736 [Mycena olivaceomarginata]